MIQSRLTEEQREDFYRRSEEVYRREIRPRVIDEHRGKLVVVDPDSGDFVIGDDELEAFRRFHALHPDVQGFMFRIGYTTVMAFRPSTLTPDEP